MESESAPQEQEHTADQPTCPFCKHLLSQLNSGEIDFIEFCEYLQLHVATNAAAINEATSGFMNMNMNSQKVQNQSGSSKENPEKQIEFSKGSAKVDENYIQLLLKEETHFSTTASPPLMKMLDNQQVCGWTSEISDGESIYDGNFEYHEPTDEPFEASVADGNATVWPEKKIYAFPRKIKKNFFVSSVKKYQKKKKQKLLLNMCAMSSFVATLMPFLEVYDGKGFQQFRSLQIWLCSRDASYIRNTQKLRRELANDEETFQVEALKRHEYGLKEADVVKAFSRACKKSEVTKADKETLKFLFHASLHYRLTVYDIVAIFQPDAVHCQNAVFNTLISGPLLGGGQKFFDSSVDDDLSDATVDPDRTDDATVDESQDEILVQKAEETFDVTTCEPTLSTSEFYSRTANFKLDRDHYKQILDYCVENQRFVRDGKNYEAYPTAGSIFVVDISEIQKIVTPNLTTTQAEQQSRTDGYRWGKNQGTNKTPTSTMPFWFARDPLFPLDPKKHVDFKKIFFKHVDHPELALVHYVGDESLALKNAPHGNTKHHDKPFKTALKSVLVQQQAAANTLGPKKIYHQVMQAELQKDGSKQLSLPRNIMQTYNAAKKQRQLERASPNTLYNCYTLARNLKFNECKKNANFITDIHIADPFFAVHLMNTPICNELLKVQKVYDGVMMLYYDTTYFVGDYYVSVLSWFHPFFGCYLPLATLVHTTRHQEIHKKFLTEVGARYGFNGLSCTFCLVTDAEFSFKGIWANIRHFFCSLHIHRNMEESMLKLLKPEEVKDLEVIFIELKTLQTFDEFDASYKNKINDHRVVWKTSDKSLSVFDKYVKKLRNKASIPALLQVIGEQNHDVKLYQSLTSNPSESLHKQLKVFLPFNREMMLDEFICAAYNFCALQYNDCYRGYFGEGSFTMREKFNKQKLDNSLIDYDMLLVVPDMITIVQNMAKVEGPATVTSNWPQIFCVEAIKNGVKISTNDQNQHTVNIRGHDPALVYQKSTREGAEKWICTCRSTSKCSHILIVLKHLGEEAFYDDDGECGDLLLDDKRTKGLTRAGRKRPRAYDLDPLDICSDDVVAKSSKTEKITVNIGSIKGEEERTQLLMNERNELYARSQQAWSLKALPKNSFQIPDSEEWFCSLFLPRVVGSLIFYHKIADPLPVLQDGEIILGITPRGLFHLVTRSGDEIHAVLLCSQLSTDEELLADKDLETRRLQYFGGLVAFCGRDVSTKKVKVKLHLHDNSDALSRRGKLLLLAAFVELITTKSTILNKKILANLDNNRPQLALEEMIRNSQKVKVKNYVKTYKLYCCCDRPFVDGAQESKMIECSSCKKWYFMSCYTSLADPEFASTWLCHKCLTVPLFVKWGKSPYINTCTLDNFLMTMMLHNASDILVETIMTKPCPSRFETELITFLNAARNSQNNEQILKAKYHFIDACYDTQNLEASEDLIWNESLVNSQYGVRCSYNCKCGYTFSHLNPADHLTVENLNDIASVIEISHSFTVRRTCRDCGTLIPPSDVRYVAETPFLFAIRLGGPICHQNISYADLERLPFMLKVNDRSYKLASISFHELGHYISIIFFSKYNVILFDGVSSTDAASPTTFKEALKRIAERRCLLSFITYAISADDAENP